jgi:bifunctional non-homologous end joining protein LigD
MLPAKPCLPTSAPSPPSGPEWLHEIKHDGYRMLAHQDGARVRLMSRRGLDWGDRFPAIVPAVGALAVRSCIIDGELIACNGDGPRTSSFFAGATGDPLRVRSLAARRPRSPRRAD